MSDKATTERLCHYKGYATTKAIADIDGEEIDFAHGGFGNTLFAYRYVCTMRE